MKKEIIIKLLSSPIYEDVLLGVEYLGNYCTHEWFAHNLIKRTKCGFRSLEMNCKPPEDVIIVWEDTYYVWDGDEVWEAGKDESVVLENDVIIKL